MENTRKARWKAAFTLLKERLVDTGNIECKVISASMLPLMDVGDKVGLQYVDPACIRKGDVVAYDYQGSISIHRVMDKIKGPVSVCFLTKGDAVFFFDSRKVDESAYLGKAVYLKKPGGQKISFETLWWRVMNYVIFMFSWAQGQLLALLQWMRKRFLNNRVFQAGERIRDVLCSLVTLPVKCMIVLTRRFF